MCRQVFLFKFYGVENSNAKSFKEINQLPKHFKLSQFLSKYIQIPFSLEF